MLFIAISDAAILAAASASGESSGPNASTTACVVGAWLAARAAAMKLPALCCGLRSCSDARLDRLSLRSRACSGSRSFRTSIDMDASSGGLQDVVALLPVAGAELVGLQCVEHAQHFLRIAADREVVHRHEADDALGIDDEGGAQAHAFGLVEDAERLGELALEVGQHREGQRLQVGVVLAPGQVHELGVGRGAVEHRVAIVELAVELAEGGDLGRTDEGEILRPEEHDLPLAGIALVGNVLEGGPGVGAHHRFEIEGRKLVADGQHETLRWMSRIDWNVSKYAASASNCKSFAELFQRGDYPFFFNDLRFRFAVNSPYFMPSSLIPSGSRKNTA